jgi:predicted Zn-dependent protease
MGVVTQALTLLNREFPNDPKVLYTTTQYLSELANRKAQELIQKDPASAQAQELIAGALQARGKTDEAAAAYRKILKSYPKEPGIHYHLGQILVSRPLTPAVVEEARKEFEAELRVNPGSPAAEYMLGELAWRDRNLEEAIGHFRRAIGFDAGLAGAYLGLGMALNASGKYTQAIPPLETYVAMDSSDPAGHYQLSIAYARTGKKLKADRELKLVQEAAAKRGKQGAPGSSEPH